MKNAKKQVSKKKRAAAMRSEYDFSGAERARYDVRFSEGADVAIQMPNGKTIHKQIVKRAIVALDEDVAAVFSDDDSVNTALRHLIAAFPKKYRKKAA